MHEASLHDSNLFVTLTYNDDHLPEDLSLRHRDFQLFMKRLRKTVGPVRFYMCGEYGTENLRPHYHCLLFGVYFADRMFFSRRGDNYLWRSPTLERLWPHGHSSFGQVTFESASYVTGYVTKKVTGDLAKEHYRRTDPETGETWQVVPEYSRMSLRPGIGKPWLDKYASDITNTGKVFMRGRKLAPPRYYNEKLMEVNPDRAEEMQYEAWLARQTDEMLDNETPERLAVRHTVAQARANLKRKSL